MAGFIWSQEMLQVNARHSTIRICYSVGLWFSKVYHYNRCIITSDAHSMRSDPELCSQHGITHKRLTKYLFPWGVQWSSSILLSNSPIFLPSLANRRKRKFVERKTQKYQALACLATIKSFFSLCTFTFFDWVFKKKKKKIKHEKKN